MKSLHFFGYYLNGLEFVTYVLIPTSIILMILLYFASNYKLIVLLFKTDNFTLYKINKACNFKQAGITVNLDGLKKGTKKEKV